MIAAQKIEECSRIQMFYQIRFLKISQNLQENTCVRVSFLSKLQAEAFSYRAPPVAASALRYLYKLHQKVLENK